MKKLILLMLIGLSSCGVNHHLKKSKKHYEKAIAKGYEPQVDTTYAPVEFLTPEVRADTIFKDIGRTDTLTLVKDRLKIKYIKDLVTNTVYIEGACEADTIIKEVPILVQEKVYITESFWESIGINKLWKNIIIAGGIIGLILTFAMRINKKL